MMSRFLAGGCKALKRQCTLVARIQKGEIHVPKVYVVSETTQHNIASALDYGQIETILPPNAQIAFSVVPTVRRIQRKLEKFTDEDFLLLIGDPSAIGITCAVAAAKNNGRFKCLKWDKRERRYIPLEVDLFKKGEIDESYDFI
jgi:hypothetical protein